MDLSDECIELITKVFNEFESDKKYKENELFVESKVFDNTYFGYTKVIIETAETDDRGNVIIKKGKKIASKGKTDFEIIPLYVDIDSYFNANVLPFNANAFMDRSKDKIGYEIPFTKIFYEYIEPRKSEEVFDVFEKLSAYESVLTKKILGKALTEEEQRIYEEAMGE